MTKQAIFENCKRVSDFYYDKNQNAESLLSLHEVNVKGLLDCYTWILDVNGAPKRGLSLLYLSNDDYKELEMYAQSELIDYRNSDELYNKDVEKMRPLMPEGGVVLKQEKFSFLYKGYTWIVKKK